MSFSWPWSKPAPEPLAPPESASPLDAQPPTARPVFRVLVGDDRVARVYVQAPGWRGFHAMRELGQHRRWDLVLDERPRFHVFPPSSSSATAVRPVLVMERVWTDGNGVAEPLTKDQVILAGRHNPALAWVLAHVMAPREDDDAAEARAVQIFEAMIRDGAGMVDPFVPPPGMSNGPKLHAFVQRHLDNALERIERGLRDAGHLAGDQHIVKVQVRPGEGYERIFYALGKAPLAGEPECSPLGAADPLASQLPGPLAADTTATNLPADGVRPLGARLLEKAAYDPTVPEVIKRGDGTSTLLLPAVSGDKPTLTLDELQHARETPEVARIGAENGNVTDAMFRHLLHQNYTTPWFRKAYRDQLGDDHAARYARPAPEAFAGWLRPQPAGAPPLAVPDIDFYGPADAKVFPGTHETAIVIAPSWGRGWRVRRGSVRTVTTTAHRAEVLGPGSSYLVEFQALKGQPRVSLKANGVGVWLRDHEGEIAEHCRMVPALAWTLRQYFPDFTPYATSAGTRVDPLTAPVPPAGAPYAEVDAWMKAQLAVGIGRVQNLVLLAGHITPASFLNEVTFDPRDPEAAKVDYTWEDVNDFPRKVHPKATPSAMREFFRKYGPGSGFGFEHGFVPIHPDTLTSARRELEAAQARVRVLEARPGLSCEGMPNTQHAAAAWTRDHISQYLLMLDEKLRAAGYMGKDKSIVAIAAGMGKKPGRVSFRVGVPVFLEGRKGQRSGTDFNPLDGREAAVEPLALTSDPTTDPEVIERVLARLREPGAMRLAVVPEYGGPAGVPLRSIKHRVSVGDMRAETQFDGLGTAEVLAIADKVFQVQPEPSPSDGKALAGTVPARTIDQLNEVIRKAQDGIRAALDNRAAEGVKIGPQPAPAGEPGPTWRHSELLAGLNLPGAAEHKALETYFTSMNSQSLADSGKPQPADQCLSPVERLFRPNRLPPTGIPSGWKGEHAAGLAKLARALDFAAHKHRKQRRKDAERTPYINHPIGLVMALASVGICHIDILCAAALHDTIEDTDTSYGELAKHFGGAVADMVREVTDDKKLPSAERKRLQVEHAGKASWGARVVKLADKLCNLTDGNASMPPTWDRARREQFFRWSGEVVKGLKGTHAQLEAMVANALKIGPSLLNLPGPGQAEHCEPEGNPGEPPVDGRQSVPRDAWGYDPRSSAGLVPADVVWRGGRPIYVVVPRDNGHALGFDHLAASPARRGANATDSEAGIGPAIGSGYDPIGGLRLLAGDVVTRKGVPVARLVDRPEYGLGLEGISILDDDPTPALTFGSGPGWTHVPMEPGDLLVREGLPLAVAMLRGNRMQFCTHGQMTPANARLLHHLARMAGSRPAP